MKFSIILVATLLVVSTADPLSEENIQTPRSGGSDVWEKWAKNLGGPVAQIESQFRVEVMEALRSILENEQSRTELLKNLRSESAK